MIENLVDEKVEVNQFYEPLKILIYNLLTNAIHFTEKGAILVDAVVGDGYITVSVKDDFCAVFGYQARSYCINVQLPVDITELNSDGISIFPNPFNSEITIRIEHSGKSELSIFDIQGRKIVSKIIDSIESVHDFQQLENGMYVVSIAALETNQVFYQRMMKVN